MARRTRIRISALNRTLEGPDGRPIYGIIQTDAAINRGNSGGPPSWTAQAASSASTQPSLAPQGTSAGLGFAIPSATVQRVLPDLLEYGYYRRPYLGIRYAYLVTPQLADALNLSVNHGLLLVQMFDESPLLQAGLRGAQREVVLGNRRIYAGGDILTAVDGHPVANLAELQRLLESSYRVGESVTLTFMRQSTLHEVQVELAEEPR